MASYSVKFSCGHEESVQLYGKNSERARKISYYEQYGKCSACYKAEKEAKRAAENAAAKEKAEAESLPELTGTPKQVAWAETIRRQYLDKLAEMEPTPGFEQDFADYKAWMLSHTESRYWIDNRSDVATSYFLMMTEKEWRETK